MNSGNYKAKSNKTGSSNTAKATTTHMAAMTFATTAASSGGCGSSGQQKRCLRRPLRIDPAPPVAAAATEATCPSSPLPIAIPSLVKTPISLFDGDCSGDS
ncbi:hypothetical protein PIB30_049498 [Stylosanthes scabra]|uniref:Uncharacterized protein n=1 Tax=Stylosanthes scabra TaxID=79078 RepID=A0ABU6SHF7_9FABA|nr:hypothetical protein [Stylosanthes scabra]